MSSSPTRRFATPVRSGSTIAAARIRESGSTTSRRTTWSRSRSRRNAATISDPNWIGNTIYFRSDRDGEYNVFAYDTGSKEVKPITHYTDFPVLDINTDGKKLIFEQAGYLHLLTSG